MKLKLNLKLTSKLIFSIIVPSTLILGISQFYLGKKTYENSKEMGIEQLDAKSRELAAEVETYINGSFETVNTLKNSCIALQGSNNPSRDDVNRIMKQVLTDNPNYLAFWIMYEPNAFDARDKYFKNTPEYKQCDGSYVYTYYKDNNKLAVELGTTEQYNEDYYAVPKRAKSNTILEPYYYSYVGDTANQVFETSVIVPIMSDNDFKGVVAVDIELSVLEKIIVSSKIFESGFASIITNDFQIASHPNKEMVTKNILNQLQSDTINIAQAIKKGEKYFMFGETADKGTVIRYFYPVHISGTQTPWSVMIEVPVSDVTVQARKMISLILIINIIGMLLFIGIIILVSRTVTKPILKAADFVNSVAQGDLTRTIVANQTDEIGIMSRNLQNMTNKLRMVVSDIITNAENISSAGSELSSASQQLSEGANEQAASTEEVSSSMEEMVSNINQNADNAQQTEQIALRASSDIEDGSQAVFATLDSMKKIAEKISIIGVIAEKTDLLAINAAIEAARAGEHGKGFAVVATEVRKLAERSQVAAKEIDELSKNSVRIADESGNVLKKIIPDIKRTSILVQEISAASMEQNSGANQINNALMQLNTVTQRNATASEEISSSAEQLVNQSDTLKGIVSFFKTGNDAVNSKSAVYNRNKEVVKNENRDISNNMNNQILKEMNQDIQQSSSSDDSIYEKY